MTGDDYINLQCELSRNGGDEQKIFELVCKAHYCFMVEGESYAPGLAAHGKDLFELERQMENPN